MFFFIPLGTTRPRWRVPYFTYGLMAVTVAGFVAQMSAEEPLSAAFNSAHPSLSGLIASVFMHGGIIHLAGNMLFLWLFATLTEDVFGARLLLGFYFLSHVGAVGLDLLVTAISFPIMPDRPLVGASGAIAGIMGLSAACFLRTKVRVWYLIGMYVYWRIGTVELGAPVFVGLWAAWELLQGTITTGLGIPSATAHWAHIGGFAVGLGGALALNLRKRVVYTDLVGGRRPVTSDFEAFRQAGELEQMVKRSPKDADAWHALGRAREASGRVQKAGEAYARALELFLAERRGEEAVAAYRALKEYQGVPELPAALLFLLACSLEQGGRKKDAFLIFRQVMRVGPPGPQTETALLRAAEIARELPGYRLEAKRCYEALLKDFPYSSWRGLAMDGLAKLRAMPKEEKPVTLPEAPRPPGKPVTRWDRLERRATGRQDPEG